MIILSWSFLKHILLMIMGLKWGGKVLRFTRNDIQLCLGIVCDKEVMDVKSTKSKPSDLFFKRHFEHCVKYIEGPAIGKALNVATNKTPSSKENNEDIARLICCYILAYAMIPSTSNYISWGWAKYVVDMSSMKQYDWASALTNHFYGCLRSMDQVNKCNGGVVNLIPYFFLEHINLSPPSKTGVFPRYIKWNMQEMFHMLGRTKFENVDGAKVFEGELKLTILENGIFSGGDNVDDMDSENENLGRDEEVDGNCTQRGSDDGREQSVAERLVGSDEVSPQFLSTDSSDALLDELKDIIHKSVGVDGISQELDKETASQQVDRAMAIVNDLSDQVKKLQADMQILEKKRKEDAIKMIELQKIIDLLYSTKLSSNSSQPLKLAGKNKNSLPHKAATLKCKEPVNVVTAKKRKLVKAAGDDAKSVFKRTTRSSGQSDAAVATTARDNALADLKSKLVLKKQKIGENSLVKQVKARTTREERVTKRRGSFLYDGENARGKSKKTRTGVKDAEKGRQDNCEDKNDEMPSFSLQMGLTQGSPVKQQKEAAEKPMK